MGVSVPLLGGTETQSRVPVCGERQVAALGVLCLWQLTGSIFFCSQALGGGGFLLVAYSQLSWECAAQRSTKAGPLLCVEIPLLKLQQCHRKPEGGSLLSDTCTSAQPLGERRAGDRGNQPLRWRSGLEIGERILERPCHLWALR